MAGTDLFGVATSGLLAYQRTMGTISHNIANANTEGYSRQSVDLATRLPQTNGFGFTGTGVNISTIQRSYDSFLETNMRSATTVNAEFEAYHSLAIQLDNILADSETGLSAAMQRFFNAVQDVADDPTDTAARQVLFNEGDSLSSQFGQLHNWMESVRTSVNNQIRDGVTDINRIGASIADLNQRIVLQQNASGGQPANDLLDQRDALLLELSNYTQVTALEQGDGSINVMIGKGQPLVVANNSYQLGISTTVGDAEQLGITLETISGFSQDITDQLTGGAFAGVIGFRDRMLDPALNSLGLTAIGMGELFNQQHRNGMDLDGALGQDFFTVGSPQMVTLNGTSGNATASISDVTQLTGVDYTIEYNAGAWSLIRNDTRQAVTMSGTGTAADPFLADGLSIEVTATPVNGESYEIRPTRTGALAIDMALGSARQIAAAAPVTTAASIANAGSGTVSAAVVTDISNAAFSTTAGTLTPPVLIQFTAANAYDVYDNTNPAAPVLLEAGIAYDAATGASVFPTPGALDYGYQLEIKGAPAAGDTFTTDYNSGGIGDNSNMLLLGNIATARALDNGITSINDSYRNLVVDIGVQTRQAEQSLATQQNVLGFITESHDAKSGVNLDEEAANLVRYQQAYQAAAQMVSVASGLFDTLIAAIRR